jgi:hypothetical protein
MAKHDPTKDDKKRADDAAADEKATDEQPSAPDEDAGEDEPEADAPPAAAEDDDAAETKSKKRKDRAKAAAKRDDDDDDDEVADDDDDEEDDDDDEDEDSSSKSRRERANLRAKLTAQFGDDPLVASAAGAAEWIQRSWRTIVLVGLIALIALMAIVTIQQNRATDSDRAFNELFNAGDSIAALDRQRITPMSDDSRPEVLLRLIDALERAAFATDAATDESEPITFEDDDATDDEGDAADADASATAAAQDRKPTALLRDAIAFLTTFISTYATDTRYADRIPALERRKARLEADRALMLRVEEAEEADADAEDGRPEPAVVVDGKPVVVFETDAGDIRIELDHRAAPNSVANLLYLINEGFFDADGPGGAVTRTERRPSQRLIGEFPAADRPGQNYDTLKDTDERVKRLDGDKWTTLFNARSVGYTVPLERSAVASRVTIGDVIVHLEETNGTLAPNSGEAAIEIVTQRDRKLDGRVAVIGRVAPGLIDLVDTLPDDTTIRRAVIEQIPAGRRERIVGEIGPDGEPRALPLQPVYAVDGDLLLVVNTHSQADVVVIEPGQVELVPGGEWYRNAAGEVVQAPNEGAVIDHFPADLPEDAEAKRLSPFVTLVTEAGEPAPMALDPQVRYDGFPTEVSAALFDKPDAPPEREFFARPPTVGGDDDMGGGGAPPSTPEGLEFDMSDFDFGGGDGGIPGMPGN